MARPNPTTTKFIGAHVSAAGGVHKSPGNAQAIGANAFALFTRNQRQWFDKPISPESVEAFKRALGETGIRPDHVLPHDSYLINLGHPEEEGFQKSLKAFRDEVHRCELLGLKLLNFHPGSHLQKISEEHCLERIALAMNHVLAESEGVTLVIENTAGQGSNVGYQFEHLAALIAQSKFPDRVGITLDTCHTFASGYDLTTAENCGKTFALFEKIVGFKYLRALHLNDSKKGLGSRVDRHDCLGKGALGLAVFEYVMRDPRFNNMPLILETIDVELWPEEIKLLRSMEKK